MSKNKIVVPNITKSITVNIALDTIKKNKQAIVFVASKKSAEKQAKDISRHIDLKEFSVKEAELLQKLSYDIEHSLENPTLQCKILAACIKKGIAFHHSGLTSKQRNLIEESFRNNLIKIICSTPTLAAGLDLPAFRTIMNSLKRFSNYGMSFIPVMEYKQMAGRAGRPGKEDFGEAIIISKEENKEEIINKFILGDVEEITSKLAVEPVLRTYILSLIAIKIIKTEGELMDFFDQTFWAHQYKDKEYLHTIIDRMIKFLIDFKFLEIKNNNKEQSETTSDFVSAKKLIQNNSKTKKLDDTRELQATKIGQKISELYLDPITAKFFIDSFEKLTKLMNDKTDLTISILQMLSSTLEIRPYFRATNKEWNFIQDFIIEHKDELIIEEPKMYEENYEDYFDQIKTTKILELWIDEIDEQTLFQKYNVRPGEIRAKIQNADWLLYSAIELAKITNNLSLISIFTKLRLRLIHGVKEELIVLLKLKGIGRVRARKLYNRNIKKIKDFEKIKFDDLKNILGEKTTIKLLKEINEKYHKNLFIPDIDEKDISYLQEDKISNEELNKKVKKNKKIIHKTLNDFF